jgi:hypothetical protein
MAIVEPTVDLILAILGGVEKALEWNSDDNNKREQYTQQFVEQARAQFPYYNVVIIHPPHIPLGKWIHQYYELPMTVGTCGYDVYFSRSGDPFGLVNEGDGGYINWAFSGYTQDGNRIWINMSEPAEPNPNPGNGGGGGHGGGHQG